MTEKRVYVAGHQGMVGSALIRQLSAQADTELIVRTHAELDLTDQAAVGNFFRKERIDQVYLAAARVGGIHANSTFPADFIYENLMIEANVIQSAYVSGVERLLFLGSSCIYPREAAQPMSESALLTGVLEPTNEPYAVAKIAGIKLCESYNRQHATDFRSVMPTNLYGPGDNYHAENSHVIPALIRRMHEANLAGDDVVTIWGSGRPQREFLHVDDMAAACLHVMAISKEQYARVTEAQQSYLNVGSGEELSIREAAECIAAAVGFVGRLKFDETKPDGAPRKLINSQKIQDSGWSPQIGFREGIAATFRSYVSDPGRR